MPLSEQEQRLLEEMERSLYHSDADFVATVGSRRGRLNFRAAAIGALLALAGIAILITGVAIRQPLVGIVGFMTMFAGVLVCFVPSQRVHSEVGDSKVPPIQSRGSGTVSQHGFMERLSDRWERRSGDH